MRRSTVFPLVAIEMILSGVCRPNAWSSPPPTYGLRDEMQDVVEEEVWRAGGPRPERMLDWLKQAEESGKPEAASAVGEVLEPLFSRRWLDPTPFVEYEQSRPGKLNVVWQQELALWKMSAAERKHAYSEVLRTGKPNDAVGLAWIGAIGRALDEHMDDLLPEIEAVLENPPRLGLGTRSAALSAEFIRGAFLPLAYARSGDWEANCLGLIREKLEVQARMAYPNSDPAANRLIREALLELVHSGNGKLVAPLKALWRSIKPPAEMDRPENQRIWEQLLKQGLRDPEYGREGFAAGCLVRAIQALGEPSFQEKNSERHKLLEDSKKRLVDAGWLKPRATPP
jgi:hypothetical protein